MGLNAARKRVPRSIPRRVAAPGHWSLKGGRIFACLAYLGPMRKVAFEPCIPTRGTKVPTGPDWFHEIKHDGYRLIVQREGKRLRLFTRGGHDWADRFPAIVEAVIGKLWLGKLLKGVDDGLRAID